MSEIVYDKRDIKGSKTVAGWSSAPDPSGRI